MLNSLLTALVLYGSGLLACLAICGLHVATTPRLTQLVPQAAVCLGIRPRVLIVLAVIGCAVLWPVTAALVSADRLWQQT